MGIMTRKNVFHITYSLTVMAAGLALLAGLFTQLDLDKSTEFAVLILLGILVEWLAVDFPLGRLSGSFSLVLATLLIYNLSASAWVSAAAFFIGNSIVNRGNSLGTTIFNMSQQVLTLYGSFYLSGLIWGREVSGQLLSGFNAGTVQLVSFIVIYAVINNLLVFIYTYPGRKGARMHSWRDSLRWDALSYFYSAPFAIVMALLYQKTGVVGVLLLFIPILSVQYVLRLYVRAELVNKELRAVYEINRSIGSNMEFSRIPALLLKEMRRVVAFHTGVVYLWDKKAGRYSAAAASGPYREQLDKDYINLGEGFWGWVLKNGEPEIVFDSRTDPRVKNEPGLAQVFRSLLAVPLIGEAGILGMVIIGDKKEMAYAEQDLDAAASLCATPTATFSNRLLMEKLNYYKERDGITGLQNRKYFYQNACTVFEAFLAAGEGHIAIILMDLDMLGHINEGWGQETGDMMLEAAGRYIRFLGVAEMQACRYGDDEFALLLPGYDETKALELVRQIRNDLADYIFTEDYPMLRIKASAGVASAPQDAGSLDDLLKKAALALKQAKKSGRDNVVAASGLKGRPPGRGNWIS